MSRILTVENVNQAFTANIWWMRAAGVEEESRNGPVLVSPGIMVTEFIHPWERVLFNPVRDANPVFHLMEAIWMLAGRNDSEWLEQFNSKYSEYADNGIVHGAYGYRWRNHFNEDQLPRIVDTLRRDPTSRQAVLQMWDFNHRDLTYSWKDRPCNTHIYFDLRPTSPNGGRILNMTVCCRSNDMLWGAYGANVVHFSILQEVLAAELSVKMGVYRQVSNNFHLYTENEIVKTLMASPPYDEFDHYARGLTQSIPFVQKDEKLKDVLQDCENFCNDVSFSSKFLREVAAPLRDSYLLRKAGLPWHTRIASMPNCDWKQAFQEWTARRDDRIPSN